MIGPNFNGTAPRFARVVGAVKRAPAMTPIGACLRCQFMVNAQQQRKELRVVQEGMAHWKGP
jgi:hypothetical protein